MKLGKRWRWCAGLTAGWAALGCGPTAPAWTPAEPAHATSLRIRDADAALRPARWVIVPSDNERDFVDVDLDGRRRIITMGLRIVQDAEGSPRRAREILPPAETTVALRVPDRLGGGFLFYTVDDNKTSLWRASTWVGALKPLAGLPFEVDRVISGFDRFYAQKRPGLELIAIDPERGALTDLGPLPDASAYGTLAFRDAWLGAIEADVQGTLVTFDAGTSWLPIDVTTTIPGISEEDGHVVVNTTRGRFVIEPTGTLQPLAALRDADSAQEAQPATGETDAEATGKPSRTAAHNAGPLGPSALTRAVLSGARDARDTAVVAHSGVLARVNLNDGRVLDAKRNAYRVGDRCQAVGLGNQLAFVCGEERGRTVVYDFVPPLSMRTRLTFGTPRQVAPSGNGRLVIRGPCKDIPEPSPELKTYCIVTATGQSEVRVRGDIGAERVVALSDGRVAILIPPRLGAAGALSIITPSGDTRNVPLKFDAVSKKQRQLASAGLWLDGWVEHPTGQLSGWVTTDGPFAGLQVQLDGTVDVGPVQSGIEATLVSGRFALQLGASDGVVRESIDSGSHWAAAHLPERMSDRVGVLPDPQRGPELERGCSPIGCAFGSWVRVGWGRALERSARLRVAPEPDAAERKDRGFTSWRLECAATGRASRSNGATPREMPEPPHAASARSDDPRFAELTSSAWRPFLGVPAPHRRPSQLGFDFGTEDDTVQVRGYAWGPRSPDWGPEGQWLLRAVDRFSVDDAIWSTAPSTVPWQESVTVAQLFGSDSSYRSSTDWGALLDPEGRAGILVIRARGETQLATVEQGRPMVPLEDPSGWGSDRLTSAVLSGRTWFAGASMSPRVFRVARIDGARLILLGNYPRYAEGLPPQVVRSTSGESVGIWTLGQGPLGYDGGGYWYVYPLDPTTGRAQTPFAVPHSALQSAPRPCGPDDEGWLVVHTVNPSVSNIDFLDQSDALRATKLEARLVVNRDGVCVQALAAQADPGPIKRQVSNDGALADRATVPMTLTDRASDTRWEFRCGS